MTLKDRLLERIRARGPMTFAEYMEAALYDPEDGFFARAPVGREFVTSPHLSPVFGALLARQVREVAEILDAPPAVLDLGAGDGMLGRQLKATIPELIYAAVERSVKARAALQDLGFDARGSLDEIEPFTGCVIANELFDNIPFHLLRDEHEVLIGTDGDSLVEVTAQSTFNAPPNVTEERPVSPASCRVVAELGKLVQRGYVFIFDYGFTHGEPIEPIRGYAENRLAMDLLTDPGSTDITGPVDFDALADAARAASFTVFGPVTQRETLMSLGYQEALADMRAGQRSAEEQDDWRAAIKTFSARGEASMLVDPSGLGSLRVLALATEGLPEPRATTIH